MKKTITLTESQLYNLIREAFENDQDWRTYMLKANDKYSQWAQPFNMSNDKFRTHQARERYKNLSKKRSKEAHDLAKTAQDIFNRRVKDYSHTTKGDWIFEPSNDKRSDDKHGRRFRSKGFFKVPCEVWNPGIKHSEKTIHGDGDYDFNTLDDFINEYCYFDDELNRWVTKENFNFHPQRSKEFWEKHGYKEPTIDDLFKEQKRRGYNVDMIQKESIVRNITENVIRKLRNLK